MFWIKRYAKKQNEIDDLSKKGCLLRFQENSSYSTTSSDGCAQKLGNDLLYYSDR